MKDPDHSLLPDPNCYKVTVHCCRHQHFLSAGMAMQVLTDTLLYVNTRFKTELLGYIFLPNQISLLINLENQSSLKAYLKDFKKSSSVILRHELETFYPTAFNKSKHPASKHRFDVWSPGFEQSKIDSEWLLLDELDQIHHQPTISPWQVVKYAEDYVYSSANFYSGNPRNIWMPVTHYLKVFSYSSAN